MWILWRKHLLVEVHGSTALNKIFRINFVTVFCFLVINFPLGRVDNESNKSETPTSTGVFVTHDGNINKFTKLLEVVFQVVLYKRKLLC